MVEQYSSNTFSDNECRLEIFPLRKKAKYGSKNYIIILYVVIILCARQ